MLQLDAKTKRATPRCCRHLRQRDAGRLVDRVGDGLEPLAHRVVGDRGQMHHGVDAVEQFGGKSRMSPKCCAVEQRFRQAAPRRSGQWAKKPLSKPISSASGRRVPQMAREDRADIAHVAGNQNAHEESVLRYHFSRAPCLLDHRSSR